MSIYLHDIPLDQAWKRFREVLEASGWWTPLEAEDITLDENAVGRILAKPIWAKLSSPHYHSSAMDGFAVRAEETNDASLVFPVDLILGTHAQYLDTGDPLPSWANAVIPIEQTEPVSQDESASTDPRRPYAIRIRASIPPWQHVRPMGEDIVATQLVLPASHQVRPVDLGAVAASGHTNLNVVRRPRVAVIPTGSELIPIGQPVNAGEIIEYNSLILAGQVNLWGGEAVRFNILPDSYDVIRDSVVRAANEFDLILLNAGSSAGSEDFSHKVIEDTGEVLVHGVAVRPGHPVILGMIHQQNRVDPITKKIPVIGVPGYPVSAALTAEIFVKPLLETWSCRKLFKSISITAKITRKLTSPAGDDDYIRVVVGRVGGEIRAAPLSRGAGVITSLVKADGITVLPRGIQGVQSGEDVKVELYCSLDEIEHTIFGIGSHDISLDLLAHYLSMYDRRLTSANVGSQAGLVALQRNEAHFAGSHLLDPSTGEYNITYVQQYLRNIPVWIIGLVYRQQGLIVEKGNPLGIESLLDLTRSDVDFVNRQRGAGTRVLLDYHLEKIGIRTQDIKGYELQEYTHLAIAAAVASKRASCGLAIAAAAKALDLDFIPLIKERYDLIVPDEIYQSELFEPLIQILKNPKYQDAVREMPGYDPTPMGQLIAKL